MKEQVIKFLQLQILEKQMNDATCDTYNLIQVCEIETMTDDSLSSCEKEFLINFLKMMISICSSIDNILNQFLFRTILSMMIMMMIKFHINKECSINSVGKMKKQYPMKMKLSMNLQFKSFLLISMKKKIQWCKNMQRINFP